MEIASTNGATSGASGARPELAQATIAAGLLDTHQSPLGGFDFQSLARAVTALAEAIIGAVMHELGGRMTPVEHGTLQRHVDALGGNEQSRATTVPPRARDSANIPGLARIARDPVVAGAIDTAWRNSHPNGPGVKQEQGFWVVRDNRSGRLSVVQFPSNGTRDSLTPGAPPSQAGKTVVAFFHTHPNTAAEGYRSGPSPADQRFATAIGVPGIIRSHDGMYYFNATR